MQDAMGLIGIYNASNLRDDISSVYMISDSSTSSLFVFVLFPGAFHDVYEIASLTMYQNVFLIPISTYPEYISDIYRLVIELTKIKTRVKVISPDMLQPNVKARMNSMFLNSLVKGSSKSSYVYSENGFIAFDWNGANGVEEASSHQSWPESFHDIYCTFGNKRILLTVNKVDIYRIKYLLVQDLVDYVYVPWQNPSYTSSMFATFVDVFNVIAEMDKELGTEYANKLVIYGFPNDAAIELASETYGSNFPINARQLFISDANPIDDWLKYITFGEAVAIATENYHLTPVYCCCDHGHKYHPLWPRPYNPMMYAPPIPPMAHCCHCGKSSDVCICAECGQKIVVKEIVVTNIPGATQTVTDGSELPDDNN